MQRDPMRAPRRNESGFTLFETLMVVSVLAILAGVVVFALGSQRAHAETAICQADGDTIAAAIAQFDHNSIAIPTTASLEGVTSGKSFIQSWPSDSAFSFSLVKGVLMISVGGSLPVPFVNDASCTTPSTSSTQPPQIASSYPLFLTGGPSSSSDCAGAAPVITESGASLVVSGSGLSPIGISDPCASSIQISGSASLSASEIQTSDSSLNSYCFVRNGACEANVPGPQEVYSNATLDPYSSLVAPSFPPAQPAASCTGTSTLTCPAGEYATSPSLGSGVTATFSSGTTIFDQPVVSDASITFGSGTYWFKGGLSAAGNGTITLGDGTYIFGSGAGSSCTGGLCLSVSAGGSLISNGPSGTLLYVTAEGDSFSGNGKVQINGSTTYSGIAIWNAAVPGTTNSMTVSNSGSFTSGFGGIYVPDGTVTLSGTGGVTSKFVGAQSIALSGSGNMAIG